MSFIIDPYRFAAAGGGSDSGPELISDLELWLNANAISGHSDDQEITTWEDDSGNNRDATGVVDNVWKPKYRSTDGPNSKPAVRMGTSVPEEGGWFTLADFLTSYTSGHAFAVVKLDADPAPAAGRAAPPTQFGSQNSNADLYPWTDSTIYDSFGSTVRKTTINPTTSLATWHLYEVRSAAGAWSLRINGATSGGDFFSTVTNTVGWTTAPRIGSHSLSGGTIMCGLLAEVFFYSRVLDQTTETLATIYPYLETKYAITLP